MKEAKEEVERQEDAKADGTDDDHGRRRSNGGRRVRFADVESLDEILPPSWGPERALVISGFMDKVRRPAGGVVRAGMTREEAAEKSRRKAASRPDWHRGFGPYWVHADPSPADPSLEANTCRSRVKSSRRCRRRVQRGCVYCFQHAWRPEYVCRSTAFADGERGGAVRGRWEARSRRALTRAYLEELRLHEEHRGGPERQRRRRCGGYVLSVNERGALWLVSVPQDEGREGEEG